jgi:hypothetical protein
VDRIDRDEEKPVAHDIREHLWYQPSKMKGPDANPEVRARPRAL